MLNIVEEIIRDQLYAKLRCLPLMFKNVDLGISMLLVCGVALLMVACEG